MLEAIWTIIKITVITAVGYVCIRWILTKAGLWDPIAGVVSSLVKGLLKGVGLGG